jgi:hypothetical protein
VKEKARKAEGLYKATLLRGRRVSVERSGDQWWVLSAEHGLTHPDEKIV